MTWQCVCSTSIRFYCDTVCRHCHRRDFQKGVEWQDLCKQVICQATMLSPSFYSPLPSVGHQLNFEEQRLGQVSYITIYPHKV